MPMRVRLHGRRYMVLLESFGVHHLAQEGNGSPPPGTGPMMDRLVFVRMVERNMQPLAESTFEQPQWITPLTPRRLVDEINFDDHLMRAAHSWYPEMVKAIMRHPHPEEITTGEGDGGAGLGPALADAEAP